MTVYTSYYALAKELNDTDYIFIRISNSKPKWWTKPLLSLPEVFPEWRIVDGVKKEIISEEQYTTEYQKMLNGLDKNKILEKIYLTEEGQGYKNVVLLCYETPDKFCHRHILADWIGGIKELPQDLIRKPDNNKEISTSRILVR